MTTDGLGGSNDAYLYKSNSFKEELASLSYSISHDLGAPLRAIDGFSKVLKEREADKLDEISLKYMDMVIENAHSMRKMIDGMLSYSKISMREPSLVSIDTELLVRSTYEELISHTTTNRDIEFRMGKIAHLTADRELLAVVFEHLIGNAIKYSRYRSKAVIEVGSEDLEDQTMIFIKDNGVGFDPEYSNKLFQLFQRLHSEDEFEGIGVGLAIVHKIISRHHGRVWGESAPDKGAIFYISLPKVTC